MRGLAPPPEFRGVFRADDDARAVYSEAAGIGRATPRAVALPANVDDLSTLVRWASSSGTPLIARGSGSSMASEAKAEGESVKTEKKEHSTTGKSHRKATKTATTEPTKKY